MRKQIVAIAMAGLMAIALAGCSGSDSGASSGAEGSAPPAVTDNVSDDTYAGIYEAYSNELRAEATVLANEYVEEAASLGGYAKALSDLLDEKTSQLAKINDEGMEKMYELMDRNGDDYSDYEGWANRLTDVYTDQVQQIADALMAAASQ